MPPLLDSAPAFAHASERGHVLLLPTGHYLAGGAAAVAASLLILAAVPQSWFDRAARPRLPLGTVGDGCRLWTSLAFLLLLVVLVAAGLWGSRDPLANPLPLTVWTLAWVGLTIIQGTLGNVWRWLDPWYAPWRMARRMGLAGQFKLPAAVGAWPALILLFGFAWFELIHPAPDDPGLLAKVVAGYWAVTLIAVLIFGHEAWTRQGEFLSVFWGLVARFAAVDAEQGKAGKRRLGLGLPGARLWSAEALPLSTTLFLLLALSSVSFDGLSKTFTWLGLNGINPLEFPGRSAMIGINSLGLAAAFVALSAAFLLAVFLGERLTASPAPLRQAAGLFVWSIVPIALAYHVSHYLTALAVNGQYALVALSDPFARGWNLFGTARLHVDAGLVLGHRAASVIWNLQALAIVAGHVVAVVVAHSLATRLHGREAARSQLPLAILMILYTVFGLWLLSTPTAA